jgi:hypothetical protein
MVKEYKNKAPDEIWGFSSFISTCGYVFGSWDVIVKYRFLPPSGAVRLASPKVLSFGCNALGIDEVLRTRKARPVDVYFKCNGTQILSLNIYLLRLKYS